MRDANARGPSIAVVLPVLLSFLHQHELRGTGVRLLDLEAFPNEHAAALVCVDPSLVFMTTAGNIADFGGWQVLWLRVLIGMVRKRSRH